MISQKRTKRDEYFMQNRQRPKGAAASCSGPLFWTGCFGSWVELTRSPRSKAASPSAFRLRVRAPGTGLKGDALSVQAQYVPAAAGDTWETLV